MKDHRVDAANERHHRSIDGEARRHGQEMSDLKSSSDAKTATHNAKMGRMKDKNKHQSDDANHMALHLVALESKLKASEARCALHQRTLNDFAQTIWESQRRQDVLAAQSEVLVAVKAAIAKNCAESAKQSAAAKRRNFGSEVEEERFVRREIASALDVNRIFDEKMAASLETLSDLNARMRAERSPTK